MAQPHGIAIVGIACRLAGAPNWRGFWDNLREGRESLTHLSDEELLAAGVPPDQVGDPRYVKAAFVLDGHDQFDPGFFGYSPVEARLIDPQQRHMLEVAWEAFEDSGHVPGRAEGPVAVFATTGSLVTSYMMNALSGYPDARYGGTASLLHLGNDKDYGATRLSFKLDLSGPSLNVQAACSTSLVMIDQACKAIRDGDCGMALVTAATVRVPNSAGYLAVKGSIFSPDGHIRAFDADARGTVFASGVAAVLLKDVDRALADGDHIYAVIKGSAVNNDGARKASYTASSLEAQSDVMRKAMAQAEFTPNAIGYVECHCTGTPVGDPKEFAALRSVFADGEVTGDRPIGSVKPNVGHTENAAGLVSLIKTALMLHDGVIVPNVNFRNPNPALTFDGSHLFVNTQPMAWPALAGPRRALVNALGMGGTNAAIAIEQAPSRSECPGDTRRRPWQIFLLSAKSAPALDAQIARHRAFLDENRDTDLADLCHTLAVGRTHFPHRFAAVVQSREGLMTKLAAQAVSPVERPRNSPRRVAFLYSGQGSQFAGMGWSLAETEPAFAAALDRVAQALDPHLDTPIRDILRAAAETSTIHRTQHTQPALFAIQVALADCLGSWGIRPMAVLGHSVGEFAAAHLAGVLSLEQAAQLVCQRGRLMGALPSGGAMAAVAADEATVADALTGLPADLVSIAAVNGPANTVISGQAEVVTNLLAVLDGRGIPAKRLTVSHAFHSPLMDPALADLAKAATRSDGVAPNLPWVSTLTGQMMTEAPTPAYWCSQAKEAVRFADAVKTLAGMGITEFVEIGPGTTLLALAQSSLAGDDMAWWPTLGKGGAECRVLLESLAGLHQRGCKVDWQSFGASFPARRLPLVGYPFEHQRLWVQPHPAAEADQPAPTTSLIGKRVRSPLAVRQYETNFGRFPGLADQRIHGAMVLPMAAGLSAALEAARQESEAGDWEVVDFVQEEPMALAEGDEQPCCLLIEPDGDGQMMFALTRQDGADAPWRTHMRATIRLPDPDRDKAAEGRFDAKRIQRRCGQSVKATAYYAALKSLGLACGPSFRGIESLWRGDGEALARIRLPDAAAQMGPDAYPHPALLDACLHLCPAVVEDHGDFNQPPPPDAVAHLPVAIERVRLARSMARDLWCHVRRRAPDGQTDGTVVDLQAHDVDGRLVADFSGIALRQIAPGEIRPAGIDKDAGWLYGLDWEPAGPTTTADGTDQTAYLLLGGDRDGMAAALADALEAKGAVTRRVAVAEVPDTPRAMVDLLGSFAATTDRQAVGIVHLCGLDGPPADKARPDDQADQRRTLGTALAMAQALVSERSRFPTPPKLWLITRNGVAATGDDPPTEIIQAGLWGFGRSFALEQPALWGGLIDLESGAEGRADGLLAAAVLCRPDGDCQSAYRQGKRLVARMVKVSPPVRPTPKPEGGAYIVTGGLGGLGRQVAEWLARRRKAEVLVLASRQGGKSAEAAAVTRQIEALGAKVVIVKADIGRKADVQRLLRRARTMTVPVRGIYHCAGVVEDGLLGRLDWPMFRRVLAPKLDGAWWLHHYSRDLPLRDFVLFSSVLALFGAAGQTNYTTSNACLDGLAAHRRRMGLPALAIGWGPWNSAGMAAELTGRVQVGWLTRGLRFIGPELGQTIFDTLFGSGLDYAAAALVDWPGFVSQFTDPPPLYDHLHGTVSGGLTADAATLRSIRTDGSPEQWRSAITEFLRAQATTILGLSETVEADRPLRDVGLDSLMAITLINRVESASGLRIPPVKMIRGPSIDDLVGDLWPTLSDDSTPENDEAGSTAAGGSWLTTIAPGVDPHVRLFCFPFAGGGAATFQGWAAAMDPAVEVIAISPPGRLSRIDEKSVRDLNRWVDCVIEAMAGKLDLPFAFFGHCLGSLTLYETACRLMSEKGVKPTHLFCSGARSPDRLKVGGSFEKNLLGRLMRMPGYRLDLPPYRQPGPVFAEIIRHFDIAASESLLTDPDLRKLMLPAVRADFEMASKYRYERRKPLAVPITCFVAIGDVFVSREDILGWGRFTNKRLQVLMREGTHYSVIEDEAFIQRVIARELVTPAS